MRIIIKSTEIKFHHLLVACSIYQVAIIRQISTLVFNPGGKISYELQRLEPIEKEVKPHDPTLPQAMTKIRNQNCLIHPMISSPPLLPCQSISWIQFVRSFSVSTITVMLRLLYWDLRRCIEVKRKKMLLCQLKHIEKYQLVK